MPDKACNGLNYICNMQNEDFRVVYLDNKKYYEHYAQNQYLIWVGEAQNKLISVNTDNSDTNKNIESESCPLKRNDANLTTNNIDTKTNSTNLLE